MASTTPATAAYINLAYVTWAGITAGKAPSFFSFTGGGPGWANFFSPDQQGFNQPDLLAYTASFGGGFSATIAAQSAGTQRFRQRCGGTAFLRHRCSSQWNGTRLSGANYTYNGMRAPDIVANLKVSQGWGSAQFSGVAHYVTRHRLERRRPAHLGLGHRRRRQFQPADVRRGRRDHLHRRLHRERGLVLRYSRWDVG